MIELLVVIAIIAILTAIVFPVFARAYVRRPAFIVWLACSLAAGAAWAAQPLGAALTVTGPVTVKRQGAASPAPLAVGAALYIGDVVTTGPTGKATLLRTDDGSRLHLNTNSSAAITAPTPVGKGRQGLFQVIVGEVAARVRPGGAVRTPSAIGGARGTEFHIKVEEDGSTTLTVLEGEVDFFNEHGAVLVGTSQESRAPRGGPPTQPQTIANAALTVEWSLDLRRTLIPREKHFLGPGIPKDELERRGEKVRRQPDSAEAHRGFGDALFDSRRFSEALAEYEQAHRIAPAAPGTLPRLGYALLELNRLDEAEAAFRAAEGPENPDQTAARVGRAWVALTRDRPEEAERLARQADGGEPGMRGEAQIVVGLARMRQPGRLKEASQAFEAALREDGSAYRYQAYAWRAMVNQALGEAAAALADGQEALRLAPQSALAHGNLALVHFFGGRLEKAEREAAAAARLNPGSVAAQVVRGQSALARGDVDAASRSAARAVALDPRLPEARYLLGVAEAQRRNYRAASHELEEALRLAPNFTPAAGALARVYLRMGREAAAVRLLTDMLQRHPHSDEVLSALGLLYYEQGRYPQAIEQLRQAIKSKPTSGLYHAELARVLLDANRIKEAIEAGQRAIALAPDVAQYHANLGLAYDFGGMPAQAERGYRRALTLDYRNALARVRLGLTTSNATNASIVAIQEGYVQDPAVSEQLLRGGIDTELSSSGGSRGRFTLESHDRQAAARGKFHHLGIFDTEGDGGERENDDGRAFFRKDFFTYVPDARTTLFSQLEYQRIPHEGFPGPTSGPGANSRDDEFSHRFLISETNVRRRFGYGNYLWAGVEVLDARDTVSDPHRDSLDPDTGQPFGRFVETERGVMPQVRFDLALNRAITRPSVLSLAFQRAFREIEDSGTGGARLLDESLHHEAGTVQLLTWLNPKTSFIGRVRAQRRHSRESVTSRDSDKTQVLPSLLLTYQPDPKTAVRLFASRQWFSESIAGFAPTDTLLLTDQSTYPTNPDGWDTLRTVQLDFERHLSTHDFLRLTLHHTSAGNLLLGDGELPAVFGPAIEESRWRSVGLGARYERQLTRNLFGSLFAVVRDTRAHELGAPFDDRFGPYDSRVQGSLALNYIDAAGTKLGLTVTHRGSFFADDPDRPGRPRSPARTYVDLRFARELGVRTEIFVTVNNLFNTRKLFFSRFPYSNRGAAAVGGPFLDVPRDAQRQIAVGITKRF